MREDTLRRYKLFGVNGRRKGKKEAVAISGHDPYKQERRYFIDTVLGINDGTLLDAKHAVNTLQVALAVKESLETKSEVSL